jgi:hypothetical protein
VQEGLRQEKRGRPGSDTRYRKTEKTVFTLTFTINQENVAYDAATDGCFPLVSNDPELSDAELLGAYRYQPNLQKRHHQLKTVLAAAPVTLKSPSRIEGLACCEFIALLSQCLIERELRAAMTRQDVTELALYHEGRNTRAPTAARIFDLYTDTARHHLTGHDGEIVQVSDRNSTTSNARSSTSLPSPSTRTSRRPPTPDRPAQPPACRGEISPPRSAEREPERHAEHYSEAMLLASCVGFSARVCIVDPDELDAANRRRNVWA